jgi:hypothetical protein
MCSQDVQRDVNSINSAGNKFLCCFSRRSTISLSLAHYCCLAQNKRSMAFKNKKKFSQKITKNGKNKPFKPKQKVKQHVREDEEIKKLLESYENLPKSSEIKTFDDLPLSYLTRKGLKEHKFKIPTEIQKQSIGPALNGSDVLGASKTGSGKTLSFLIPVLENLYRSKWTRIDGVGAVSIFYHYLKLI